MVFRSPALCRLVELSASANRFRFGRKRKYLPKKELLSLSAIQFQQQLRIFIFCPETHARIKSALELREYF